MPEVPWFTDMPEARLYWGDEGMGYLHFIDPKGHRAVVLVQPDVPENGTQINGQNVWRIEGNWSPGEVVTLKPSVHFVGHWHSPNPVQFKLVKEFSEPTS